MAGAVPVVEQGVAEQTLTRYQKNNHVQIFFSSTENRILTCPSVLQLSIEINGV